MTSTQMTARSNELVAERMVTYRASLQDQLQQYLEKQRSNGIPSLTPGSEVVELDAWYNSLTEPTAQQRSIYFSVKANINRMMGN
jgi:protein-tyrosine phosphatase